MEEQNPVQQNSNRFPKWLITVTPLSKALAMILFIAFPFIGFYLGMQYQQKVTISIPVVSEPPKTPTLTPTLQTTTNWKIYDNTRYNFSIKYSPGFSLEEDLELTNFYDNIVKFSSYEKEMNIRIIHDIDIYKNASPKDVALREIMDSGLEYKVDETKINNLATALVETTDTYNVKSNPGNGFIAIVSHPTSNLFAEISINFKDKILFNQILQTFKFSN